jgi:hypothetical protein
VKGLVFAFTCAAFATEISSQKLPQTAPPDSSENVSYWSSENAKWIEDPDAPGAKHMVDENGRDTQATNASKDKQK